MRCLVLATALLAPLVHGIANGAVPVDETYDAVGAFGLASDLFSGHTWFCSAVLVRPNAAIVAKHCVYPLSGAQAAVRFRRKPDGSIGSVEKGPDTFYNVTVSSIYIASSGGDAAVAYLTENVTHIASIPVALAAPSLGAVTVAGWGKGGPGLGEGSRELRSCPTSLWYAGEQVLYFLSAWNGASCGPNSGDSGGPVLRDPVGDGSQMAVIGIINYPDSATSLAQYAGDENFSGSALRKQ